MTLNERGVLLCEDGAEFMTPNASTEAQELKLVGYDDLSMELEWLLVAALQNLDYRVT